MWLNLSSWDNPFAEHPEYHWPTLKDCYQDGRGRALGEQDCTVFPLIAASHICRIAQEQCCSAVVGDKLCTSGINRAKEQGACVVPFTHGGPCETKTTKMCCDCCLLGLMSACMGNGCELALDLGKQCQETAHVCCGGVRPEHNKPAAGAQGSTKCSHLCVGKGTCACFDGYRLKPNQHNCEEGFCSDMNECVAGSHSCAVTESCFNVKGGFRCLSFECPPNFRWAAEG
ncbi:fibulin-1-like [Salvelinus fontinalis]|uniref:fibulin-1-like n=1 Tax=Salvelinus fontinalis TaxID=8038 RepID=UPI002485E735|nr:fibulin-1-like [Salvelinus fontinalis]